jgi:hypothetical protein
MNTLPFLRRILFFRVTILAPGLRRVLLCGVKNFLYHSSTIELLLLLNLIKGFYLSSKGLLRC